MEIVEVEKQVFRKLLSNRDTIAANLAKVSPDDFTQPLLKAVIDALSKEGRVLHFAPNPNYFEIVLRDTIKDQSRLEQTSAMLAKISGEVQDAADLEVLIKELKANRMCRELTRIIKGAIPRITPGDVEGAYDELMTDLLRLPLSAASGISVATVKELHDSLDERIQSYLTTENTKFPTGISAFDESIGGFAPGEFVVITAGTGMGKCLSPGTKVLKYSGEPIPVEHIKTGDSIMGPDSKPRRVLSTTSGTDQMYRITPTSGEPWVCNSQHVLTLVHTVTGKIIDIGLQDYIKQTKKFKHEHKHFFVGVDFPRQSKKLPVDPYFLGVWYGDGTKKLLNVGITKPDPEIRECVSAMAQERGLLMRTDKNQSGCPTYRIAGERGAGNGLLDDMRQVVGDCQTIPHEYLTASREDRAALLAGLLDTDGHLRYGGFEIVQKRKGLAEGVCFLARSLGLRAIMSEKRVAGYTDSVYHRVSISGDCTILPLRIKRKIPTVRRQKKNITRTGFSVDHVGFGEYFGFSLDGDGRFLLGDFTVTHNSNLMLWWAEQYVKGGANVLYVTIEMSYDETMHRYHAIATGYPSSDISNKRIPQGKLPDYYAKLLAHAKHKDAREEILSTCAALDEEKKHLPQTYIELGTKFPNRVAKFFVMDIDSANAMRIEREIQRISMDDKIDYVFVDFINVMDPMFHNKDKVKELASISRDLKKVARKTKVILFSAAQLDTTSLQGTQNEKIDPDRVKYSRAIGENADWMIAFNRTDEDNRLKQVRLQLAKHRHSGDAIALLEFDFATLQAIDLGKPDPTPPPHPEAPRRTGGAYYPGKYGPRQEEFQ